MAPALNSNTAHITLDTTINLFLVTLTSNTVFEVFWYRLLISSVEFNYCFVVCVSDSHGCKVCSDEIDKMYIWLICYFFLHSVTMLILFQM